ncbi:hypothetical protein [Patulibacter americanus]|uniref:hypothetical protein n=1 Tax=Patulibacter americanus TaxID=588672 RepID=UPI0003B71578|nr:hypothetical protein [Patulibacter americanus]
MQLSSENLLVQVPVEIAGQMLADEGIGARAAPGVRDGLLMEASAIAISTMAVSADALSLVLSRDQIAPFAKGLLSAMRQRRVAEVTVSAVVDGYQFKATVRHQTSELDAAEVLRQAADFVEATRPPPRP